MFPVALLAGRDVWALLPPLLLLSFAADDAVKAVIELGSRTGRVGDLVCLLVVRGDECAEVLPPFWALVSKGSDLGFTGALPAGWEEARTLLGFFTVTLERRSVSLLAAGLFVVAVVVVVVVAG